MPGRVAGLQPGCDLILSEKTILKFLQKVLGEVPGLRSLLLQMRPLSRLPALLGLRRWGLGFWLLAHTPLPGSFCPHPWVPVPWPL